MDLFAHPVTVAGLVSFVALGAWAMGRLQGAASVPDNAPAMPETRERGGHAHCGERANAATGAAAGQSQPGARSQLLSALALADSLGDLHEEISAFRRQERVFATLAPDLLQLRAMSDDCATGFRRIGATDQPGGPAADGFVVTSLAPLVQSDDRLNPRQAYRS
jgi:hypothetical protein